MNLSAHLPGEQGGGFAAGNKPRISDLLDHPLGWRATAALHYGGWDPRSSDVLSHSSGWGSTGVQNLEGHETRISTSKTSHFASRLRGATFSDRYAYEPRIPNLLSDSIGEGLAVLRKGGGRLRVTSFGPAESLSWWGEGAKVGCTMGGGYKRRAQRLMIDSPVACSINRI